MGHPTDVVREFCSLMERRDADALRGLIADHAVYHNVGMPAVTGVEAIVESLAAQFAHAPDAYAYELVNIAADGPVVLTERIDYIQTPDGGRAGVPVMGTFVVDEHGRITRWTDYFDFALASKLGRGEDVTGLVPDTAV